MERIENTDASLVEASRRGELDAFGLLVARYQDVVCAVGYSSTGDRVLGEDVAQETFIAAWRQLDRVRDVMRLGPWLCGIARNIGHKIKKRTRREQLGEPDDQIATTPSAFDELARGDTERIVREALARVPESYREVLVLYYCEDQSIRDVAKTLDLSEEAAMQRLSRGRCYLANSVTALVESSLKDARPRRDLVAAVLAAIAAFAIPSHVDASVKPKGSTMLKLTLAASTLVVVGTTAYVLHSRHNAPAAIAHATPSLHYGTGTPRPPALGPTAPRHVTATRKTAANDLGLLPADSDFVFGIDMSRIQSSSLWQKFVAPMLANQSTLHDAVALCGFDPLAAVQSVSIGARGFGGDAITGTIVIHGLDKTKTMACAATAAGRGQITVDGDVALIGDSKNPNNAVGLTFLDASTALVVVGPGATTTAGVEQAARGGSGLEASPAFSELFANINSDDPLWLVVVPGSPVFGEINGTLAAFTSFRLSAVYGSIDVTDSLVVQAGVRLGSPDQVAALVAELQTRLDQYAATGTLARYFTQLDVNSDGGDLVVSVAANTAQLVNIAMSRAIDASITSATADGPGTFSVGAKIPME